MLSFDLLSRSLPWLRTVRPRQAATAAGALLAMVAAAAYLAVQGRPAQARPPALPATAAAASGAVHQSAGRERDYRRDYVRRPLTPLVAEEVFARQDGLLGAALDAIAPSRPGSPGLYFVAVAPDGAQDVFRKEALYGAQLFQNRFGAAQRTLTLVNSRESVEQVPLATVTNLDRALRAIGRKMDPQQDILFLYLTSHGSRDAELVEELDYLSLTPFTATRLAQMLHDSGILWKVIVVSACYSGSSSIPSRTTIPWCSPPPAPTAPPSAAPTTPTSPTSGVPTCSRP
ncbi:MAG: C13 family peptidase [Nevskia sp.]|nr:C13 family peptidase [Nevskia sp.]